MRRVAAALRVVARLPVQRSRAYAATAAAAWGRARPAPATAGLAAAAAGFWCAGGTTQCEAKVAKRPPLTAEENATIQLFNSCCDSVCNVTNLSSQRGPFSTYHDEAVPQGAGSGFVWDAKGHIVTNFHVIQGASQLGVTLAGCPKPFAATLVGCDPERDIAVLRILAGRKLRPLPIGTSNDLQVGQKVIAIGNPFGLDHVISGLGREIAGRAGRPIQDVIQTDAAMNPGNSGGPLIDSAGRVIGVNTAIYSPSGASAGIGFAIPIDMVAASVEQLVRYGHIRRPSLGISIAPDHLLPRLGIRDRQGVLIMRVNPGSGAAVARVRATTRDWSGRVVVGDIITALNDTPIRTSVDLFRALERRRVGERVSLQVVRTPTEAEAEKGIHARELSLDIELGEMAQ